MCLRTNSKLILYRKIYLIFYKTKLLVSAKLERRDWFTTKTHTGYWGGTNSYRKKDFEEMPKSTYYIYSLKPTIRNKSFYFYIVLKSFFLVYRKKKVWICKYSEEYKFYLQVSWLQKFMIFSNSTTFLKCRQTSVTANCPWCVCNTLKIKQYNVINPITVYNL